MKYPSLIAQTFRQQTQPLQLTDNWRVWTERQKEFGKKFIGPKGGLRFVKYHHEVFGKEGRFRYDDLDSDLYGEFYVWQDPKAGWRVYIRQRTITPIQFEIFPGFDPEIAWLDYIGRFKFLFDLTEVKKVMNS